MKNGFIFLALLAVSTGACAQSAAELARMMDEVRSIVTEIGADEDVKNFDNQMDKAQRLKNESAVIQAETVRTRSDNEKANREIKRNNEIAEFENITRNEQQKKNDANRISVSSPENVNIKCRACK